MSVDGNDLSAAPPSKRPNCLWIVTLLSLVWAVVVGYRAYVGWPHVPLDISASDAATRAAFEGAVQRHLLTHVLIAVLPALVLLPIAARACRRKA